MCIIYVYTFSYIAILDLFLNFIHSFTISYIYKMYFDCISLYLPSSIKPLSLPHDPLLC